MICKKSHKNNVGLHFQLKESASKNTDLQHQLEKAKQQHQELQALQQNTNGKLREAQVQLRRSLRRDDFEQDTCKVHVHDTDLKVHLSITLSAI